MYLAIDPGSSRQNPGVGWASFDELGKLVDFGQILPGDLTDLLKTIQPVTIICENFRNRPGPSKRKAFYWKENIESQIIGGLRMYVEMNNGKNLILQEPQCKNIGAKHSNVKVPKDHKLSHEVDAYSHGVYYLVHSGKRAASSYLKKEVIV